MILSFDKHGHRWSKILMPAGKMVKNGKKDNFSKEYAIESKHAENTTVILPKLAPRHARAARIQFPCIQPYKTIGKNIQPRIL